MRRKPHQPSCCPIAHRIGVGVYWQKTPNLAVDITKAMSTDQPTPALKSKLRWYQFSLAELVSLTTLAAACCSLIKCFPWSAWLVASIGVWIVAIYIERWRSSHDPSRTGRRYSYAVLFFLFFGPLGAIFWLALRLYENAGAAEPPAKYADPEDALAAASVLERIGDWDAAVLLYAEIAARWPEHRQYARECILQGEAKRSRVEQT